MNIKNLTELRSVLIASAQLKGNELTLKTQDALLVGRLRITGEGSQSFITDTALPFSPTYNGTTLLNDQFSKVAEVESVGNGAVKLSSQPTIQLNTGENAWLSDVGIGDRVEIKSMYFKERF